MTTMTTFKTCFILLALSAFIVDQNFWVSFGVGLTGALIVVLFGEDKISVSAILKTTIAAVAASVVIGEGACSYFKLNVDLCHAVKLLLACMSVGLFEGVMKMAKAFSSDGWEVVYKGAMSSVGKWFKSKQNGNTNQN